MDRELVYSKLEALRGFVERIRSRTPASVEALRSDPDLQDIVSVNLERAVQVCVDIAAHIVAESSQPPPTTMAGGFEALARLGIVSEELALQLKKAVGFRNIAVHTYQDIDWEVVHAIATTRLHDFIRYAECVSKAIASAERD